jgi:hypothetical protein
VQADAAFDVDFAVFPLGFKEPQAGDDILAGVASCLPQVVELLLKLRLDIAPRSGQPVARITGKVPLAPGQFRVRIAVILDVPLKIERRERGARPHHDRFAGLFHLGIGAVRNPRERERDTAFPRYGVRGHAPILVHIDIARLMDIAEQVVDEIWFDLQALPPVDLRD